MKAKERLYAVMGGCVGAVLTMVVCSFFPLGVQSQGDSFGEITCTGLNVVGPDGTVKVELTSNPVGMIRVFGGDGGVVALAIDKNGGFIVVGGKGRDSGGVTIQHNQLGGVIRVSGNGPSNYASATMDIKEHGGRVTVFSKRNADERVHMGVTQQGGSVAVFGEGNNLSRAIVTVNEYGNGAISTWDKNGYRLANLK